MDTSDISSSSKSGPNRPDDLSADIPACDECRNRKIKCNRELPICSNCRKAKVPCEFPTRDKKGSQVRQIANDIITFHERLSVVEGNLAQRIEVLTDIVSRSINLRNGRQGKDTSTLLDACLTDSADETDEAAESGHGLQRSDVEERGVIINDGSAERFYGETSTYSYFIQARQSVKQILEQRENRESASTSSELQACFEEVRRLYDTYAMPSYYQEDVLVDENAPLELPPRELVEASVDFYLENPRIEPPLFQRETLMSAMNELYSTDSPHLDESWVLCFNSIILQSMGWVSKILRNDGPRINGMDDHTLSSLLTNANRALRKLERFCALRMVNVQALLLLAFVARDYIHFNIFERVFDRACQIAKQMGLHERPSTEKTPSAKETERQDLIWLLYLVDKQRVFIRGSPCRLYIFDCNMELPALRSSSWRHRARPAYLELACLLEEIYKQLYSPRASRLRVDLRKERLRRIEKQLDTWFNRYQAELEAKDSVGRDKAVLLQLRYAWHITRLLVASRDSESSGQSRLDMARAALQIIQTLCGGPYIFDGGLLVLERLFCDYSVVAFYEVFGQIVTQPHVTGSRDLELLSTTTSALGLLSHPSRADAYCPRLHRTFMWCTNIATNLYKARELQHKRSLIPLLPKPVNLTSSALFGQQRSSPVAQSSPSVHHRNNLITMGDSAASSRAHSTPESTAPQLHTQEIASYARFPNMINSTADATSELYLNTDLAMQQYLGGQELPMAELAFGQQPMSDFLFDTTICANTQPVADPRPQHNYMGQPFLSTPDSYIWTPVRRIITGESGDTRRDDQRRTGFGSFDVQDAFL